MAKLNHSGSSQSDPTWLPTSNQEASMPKGHVAEKMHKGKNV